MKFEKESLKSHRLAVSLLAVGILVGAIVGYSFEQGGTTFTIASGLYPGAPSYTVWREGSTYYAKDMYGAMLFDYPAGSSNASQLMENVLSTIPSTGGKIFLKSCSTYPASTYSGNIVVNKNFVTIEAEQGAVWEGTIFVNNYYCTIKHLQFNGLQVNKWELRVQDCAIVEGGLSLRTNVSQIFRCYFTRCNFINCSILIQGESGHFVNEIHFQECYFEDSQITVNAVYPCIGLDHIVFSECYLYNSATYAMILYYGHRLKIVSCHFDTPASYALFCNTTITSANVIDCSFHGQGVYDISNGTVTFSDLQDWIVENSGYSYVATDGLYISHGLNATPTTVLITMITSLWGGKPLHPSWDRDNTNSTHFRIRLHYPNGTTFTNTCELTWWARYEP